MPEWPDLDAVLADFGEHVEAEGGRLVLRSRDDLEAGMQRARLAADYADPDLMFEGIATRRPLLDGNKRLAFLVAVDFLDISGLILDAPEESGGGDVHRRGGAPAEGGGSGGVFPAVHVILLVASPIIQVPVIYYRNGQHSPCRM